MLDFIDGPAPVLSMLCQEARIHQVPISFSPISKESLDATKRIFPMWSSANEIGQIMRRYGASSERYSTAKTGSIYKHQGVDMTKKNEYTRQLNEKLDEIQEYKKDLEKMRQTIKELQGRRTETDITENGINQERVKMKKAAEEYAKLKGQKSAKEGELASMQKLEKEYTSKITEMELRVHDLTCKRAEKSIEFSVSHKKRSSPCLFSNHVLQTQVSELVELHHAYVQANLCHIEATSDVMILEQRVARIKQEIATQKKECDNCELCEVT